MTQPETRRTTSELDKVVGNLIREARNKRNMTLDELAKKLGISYQQQHKYETGVNRVPVVRLCHTALILEAHFIDLLPTRKEVGDYLCPV